jgi:hypothetical protein
MIGDDGQKLAEQLDKVLVMKEMIHGFETGSWGGHSNAKCGTGH